MEDIKKKTKALVLFSGGLDSILATLVLREQGTDVVGLTFISPFFGSEEAERSAREIDLPLLVKDFTQEHLEMMKSPKHGFGKNMNPCIDCHALMLRLAKVEMENGGFAFVATGEVLGERPMSQNRQSLETVGREAGLSGKLLRPLSAGLLPETEIERKGLVDRTKLLSISGRSRSPQLSLAKKYGLEKFPSPSGGCLLTDKIFSENLKKLLERHREAEKDEIEILKLGRQIWEDDLHIVVGRNEEENLSLKRIAREGDLLAEAVEVPGPTILIRNYSGVMSGRIRLEPIVKDLLIKYNNKAKSFENISINWIS